MAMPVSQARPTSEGPKACFTGSSKKVSSINEKNPAHHAPQAKSRIAR